MFLLFSACLKTPDSSVVSPEKLLVLSGVLQNIKNYQIVKLYRAFSVQEIDSIVELSIEDTLDFYFGISDAEVVLLSNDSIYNFEENILKKGEYLLKNFKPESGKEYKIQIKKEGFKTLIGHTKYPIKMPFNLTYRFDDKGDLHLNWGLINEAKGYRIDLYRWERIRYGPYDYYQFGYLRAYMKTTSNLIIPKQQFNYKDAVQKIKILVWAIDENYYQFYNFHNYYHPFEFHLIDYGNFSTVQNGLGYFGSAYGDSMIIELPKN